MNEDGIDSTVNFTGTDSQGPSDEVSQFSMTEEQIISLLDELKKESAADDRFRTDARVIEKICLNQATADIIDQSSFARIYNQSNASLQLLYNKVLTWSALMTGQRPTIYGVPTNNDIKSVAGAKIATKLIEYIEGEQSCQSKWHQSALYAAMHGSGLMKIIFNSSNNKIEWHPLSIFDVFVQNAKDFDEIQWCVIRDYIDQYDAKALLKQVDPEAEMPSKSAYVDGAGITREGVEKFEIWYKPGNRFEKGLYACVIDGTVVEAMDYPYYFDEPDAGVAGEKKALLPIVLWSCRETRGSSLGTSWTKDCAGIQSNINQLFFVIQNNAKQARQMLMLPSSLRNSDLLDEENARIFIDPQNSQAADLIRWVNPAPVDQNIQSALELNINAMHESSGISPSTSGQAAASQSGKALAYQAQLDTDKHSAAFKSLERAQRNAWELTLKLIQRYFAAPQTIQITGEDPLSFMGADIAGVNVKLEHRQESEGMMSTKASKAREDISAGFGGKELLLDSAPTPLTAGLQLIARQNIEKYLRGEPVNMTPESMPPEILVGEIDRQIQSALVSMDNQRLDDLNNLKNEYLMMIAGAQEPQEAAMPQGQASQQPLPESVQNEPPPNPMG